jgi:hypothetical protein
MYKIDWSADEPSKSGRDELSYWTSHALVGRLAPTIVLTAGIVGRDEAQSDAVHEDFVVRWKADHDALAARSSTGESKVVSGAHHFIQLDEPRVVIDAIRKVIAEVQPKIDIRIE